MDRAKRAHEVIRRDTRHSEVVNRHRTVFQARRPRIESRTVVINNYYHSNHRHTYSAYYSHGFYSGYYYPVRPCTTIADYFFYPMVFWLYANAADDTYYRSWYGSDLDRYSVRPFRYANVYYPTDTLRDLAIEVSAMPSARQDFFRTAMINLTEALAQQIANNLGRSFTLDENDIVVNHYRNLRNQAILVEGFVDRDGVHRGFKALLDLENPRNTMVFVPVSTYPTESELYTLRTINDRIERLGGNPYEADMEPNYYREDGF